MTTLASALPPHIEHRVSEHRFEAIVDGESCVADYRLTGDVMSITHTEVPPRLGGRGIAAALTQAALEHARAAGLKVRPLCSYARAYMQRHPETLALLA
jgi:predicted GNAT family acetyltransferase